MSDPPPPTDARPPIRQAGQGLGAEPASDPPPTADVASTLDIRVEPARTIGKFQLLERLGEGGQATAWLALDPDLGRSVVIKCFHGCAGEGDIERILAEGRALVRIDSPYVARCYSVERDGTQPFLVMEYVRGEPLHKRFAELNHNLTAVARIIRQVVEGVAAVHACGLIHRDLKPANILLDAHDRPTLIDFGLAVPLASRPLETLSGTLAYMPPEQARCEFERIDFRSDLFAVGAVLYHLLAGRPPYAASDGASLMEQARRARIVPVVERNPTVPPELARICDACLAADPALRPESAAELGRQLDQWLAAQSRLQGRFARRGMAAAGVACALVAVWLGLRPDGQSMPASTDIAPKSPPSASAATTNATPSSPPRHPDGRALRQDFLLEVAFVGASRDTEGWLRLHEGDAIELRITCPRKCFLRVWSVQADAVLQVYPNSSAADSYLSPGESRIVPGGSGRDGEPALVLRAKASQGFEFLHVLAAAQPLAPLEGQALGPYVVFQSQALPKWQQTVRGFVLAPDEASNGEQAISEVIVPVHVAAHPSGEASDS